MPREVHRQFIFKEYTNRLNFVGVSKIGWLSQKSFDIYKHNEMSIAANRFLE